MDYGYPTISQNPSTVHWNALSGSVIISMYYKYKIQLWPWHAGGCPKGEIRMSDLQGKALSSKFVPSNPAGTLQIEDRIPEDTLW